VQHVEYVPFGEVFIEERNNTWNTPYLFNGKELDEETGLYYYGARYYNPRESLWLSVDPLAEDYPDWSPYSYAMNNPLVFIDPTGMAPEEGGPIKPPKSATESTLIYGLKLGNADQEYQDFAKSLSSEDLFNVVNSIYDQKMVGYTGAVGQALYGLDLGGNVAVPEGIREKVWAESEALMPNAIKDYWTAQQTGLDPSSVSFMLNPFDQIQWRSTRALAVTSNNEALGMIGQTTFEAAAGYLGERFIPFNNTHGLKVKALKASGGEINGFSISPGSKYGAQPRFDVHPLNHPSRRSNTLTIPESWKGNVPLPHYHKGKGNGLRVHRPWELDKNGKRIY
jgi:RHS repeat-associated protein